MREPKLITVCGRKGCGKSHETVRILYEMANGNPAKGIKPRRSLIFDVNDEFGDFEFMGKKHTKIPSLAIKDVVRFTMSNIIEVRRIRPYFDDGRRMTIQDMSDTLSLLLSPQMYNCGTFVVEDPAKYLANGALTLDVVSAMISCRHSEIDLICHYQSLGRTALPQLFANTNYIRMHKTSDTASRHENKFEEKLELIQLAENVINLHYERGDNRFYLYVDVESSKIRPGTHPFDDADVNYSIQQYISQNGNRVLRPLLNMLDMESGQPIYTKQTALQELAKKLRRDYFA